MPRETLWERVLGYGLGAVLAAVFAFPLLVGLSAYRGWAFMLLWNWFVVPVGAPPLGLAGAIGIALCATFVTDHTPVPTKDGPKPDIPKVLGKVILGPLYCVAWGALVKHFL
jgi:hypothetical protein